MYPPRQGPRPLPLHLLAQAGTLLASLAALPSLKNGSLSLNSTSAPNGPPDPTLVVPDLEKRLHSLNPEDWGRFTHAVAAEALTRHRHFVEGVAAYRRHPLRRTPTDYPVLWQEGSTRLLDCRMGQTAGPPVLIIPSLINRSYVLDLTPRSSLLRGLHRRKIAPFLVDWGTPGLEEQGFTLTDYLVRRLIPALSVVHYMAACPVALLGYCMGGLLALALAQHQSWQVSGLGLLATPWDFQQGFDVQRALLAPLWEPLRKVIQTQGQLPVDMLQTLFASFDPDLTARKFSQFGTLPTDSRAAKDFVLLEDWANDGVPLAGPVAQECLEDWYLNNSPALGKWRIDGMVVDPQKLTCPSLVIIPERDRIVTMASALALAERLPQTAILPVVGGHVGMLLSRRVGSQIHAPIAMSVQKWVENNSQK